MKLEDLVCDFEYAEKLKELGVKRDTNFSYFMEYKGDNKFNPKLWLSKDILIYKIKTMCVNDTYSAFTTDELLEMLPKKIIKKFLRHTLDIHKLDNNTGGFIVFYTNMSRGFMISFTDYKLSNALAQLLIWCIENGFVEVKNED